MKKNCRISNNLLLIFLLINLSISFVHAESVFVSKVIDGDTLILKDGRKIRLIGVDTTEKSDLRKPVQYYSAEASAYLKKLAEKKKVELKYDKVKTGEKGRTLGYLFLKTKHGKIFINKEIISEGYGFAYTRFPFKYKKEFIQAEKDAKRNKKGLWKDRGRTELLWILKNKQQAFEIFQMSGNLWGLKYLNFCYTRRSLEEILFEINKIKYLVNEFAEKDLWTKLKKNNWEKISF